MFHWLEKNPFFFSVGVFLVIAFAGLIEILPNFAEASRPVVGLKPYTVLELAGKEVYKKDNCLSCHSQLIRPFKSETDRYGQYSLSGEYAYDRPFLWGSKRTGPDLHRVGNYRTTDWHENHMWEPSEIVPGSIMPAFKHQFTNIADIETAYAEAVTVKNIFATPYGDEFKGTRAAWEAHKPAVLAEAKLITDDMSNKDFKSLYESYYLLKITEESGNSTDEEKARAKQMAEEKVSSFKYATIDAMLDDKQVPEVVALIAYLNRLK